ncbi:[Fe-Fe] hydrogenase large subunit C-terminal domain-containing protein [Candidatus Cloacimonadota bacterium]
MNKKYYHAVEFVTQNCTGCTKCVKVCPTEALRVREGKVKFDKNRCIDCWNCIIACDFDAIRSISDDLGITKKFKYRVAVLSASFDGQFPKSVGNSSIENVLGKIGFDEVARESMVTTVMVDFIRDYIKENAAMKPIISSDCPSIVRLIQVRFPSLLPNLLHIESPMRILSVYLKEKISKQKGLREEEVGIFNIVPCISHVTAAHQPEGTFKNAIDAAISIRDIYTKVIDLLKENSGPSTDKHEYLKGLGWAITGIQAEEVNDGELKTLAVNGIQNVIKILQKIEDQQIDNYDYVVLSNCINGCVGGILNVENPFVATSRIKDLIRNEERKDYHKDEFFRCYKAGKFDVQPLEPRSIMTLDKDIKTALVKMKKIDDITDRLPGLDCSACGSPSCRVLAEDIVSGKASMKDCIILLRKQKKR